MPCIEIKSKKYQTRKGPPYHANDCKGVTKKGNDGKEYISTFISKQKTYRWVPKSSRIGATKKKKGVKTYIMIDNGGEPFVADVSSRSVDIYKQKLVDGSWTRDKKVVDTPYSRVFIGDNLLRAKGVSPKGKYPGNSILIKSGKGKYIYSGSEIYAFETIDKEDIKEYYSPVGNSEVAYPYAVGEKHTYFMLDKEALPNEALDLKSDAYPQFYKLQFSDKPVKTKKIKTKMIQKRLIS
jgi:hypothetical protein